MSAQTPFGGSPFARAAQLTASRKRDCAASCDRVALLANGSLEALGTPDAVLTPAHLAAALGVRVRRLDDPCGGPPFLRVEAA